MAEAEPPETTETLEAETAQPQAGDHAPADDTLLVAIPEGVEPELLEIFLEEANEVLAAMARQQCLPEQSRRPGFDDDHPPWLPHAESSGRMVGLNDLGEVAVAS